MLTKTFPAHLKAVADLADGEFDAIVSVFGNVDSAGDVVLPGAFTETLAAWAASGDPIPVIWSHQWGDPDSHIGTVVEAKELLPGDPALPAELADHGGLWVRSKLDDDGKAVKVRRLLKGRRVRNFSFAYDVLESSWGKLDGADVYELRKLDLFEVGPCLIGVNRETQLIAAKEATRPNPSATVEEPADHPPAKGHPSCPRLPAAELTLLKL